MENITNDLLNTVKQLKNLCKLLGIGTLKRRLVNAIISMLNSFNVSALVDANDVRGSQVTV